MGRCYILSKKSHLSAAEVAFDSNQATFLPNPCLSALCQHHVDDAGAQMGCSDQMQRVFDQLLAFTLPASIPPRRYLRSLASVQQVKEVALLSRALFASKPEFQQYRHPPGSGGWRGCNVCGPLLESGKPILNCLIGSMDQPIFPSSSAISELIRQHAYDAKETQSREVCIAFASIGRAVHRGTHLAELHKQELLLCASSDSQYKPPAFWRRTPSLLLQASFRTLLTWLAYHDFCLAKVGSCGEGLSHCLAWRCCTTPGRGGGWTELVKAVQLARLCP